MLWTYMGRISYRHVIYVGDAVYLTEKTVYAKIMSVYAVCKYHFRDIMREPWIDLCNPLRSLI